MGNPRMAAPRIYPQTLGYSEKYVSVVLKAQIVRGRF